MLLFSYESTFESITVQYSMLLFSYESTFESIMLLFSYESTFESTVLSYESTKVLSYFIKLIDSEVLSKVYSSTCTVHVVRMIRDHKQLL
jgi:hypothetical protein